MLCSMLSAACLSSWLGRGLLAGMLHQACLGRWLTAAQKRIVGRNRGEGSGSLEIGPVMPGIVEFGPTADERLMGRWGGHLAGNQFAFTWICNDLL